jgi:hypothetical protein
MWQEGGGSNLTIRTRGKCVTRDEMTDSSRCRFGYWTLDDMVTKIDNLGTRVRATRPLQMWKWDMGTIIGTLMASIPP